MRYLAPVCLLLLVPMCFSAAVRRRARVRGPVLWVSTLAALPLVVSGTAHFLTTETYASLIPPQFPQRSLLVLFSGACELAGAAGLFLPRTRRPASVCLVLLMIAVFPANVYIAGQKIHGITMPGIAMRTAMQAVYILLLLVAGWGMPTKARSSR